MWQSSWNLGPCEVLDTVMAQQEIVRHLLDGDCREDLRRPLSTVDSDMATTIGGYLLDMGQSDAARRYFDHGRRAGHQAHNPACAAYAAANTSLAAFLRGDTPTALDTAAAARSLAARTDDPRLKAVAELHAARALMKPWDNTPAVTTLDAQLNAYGLKPTSAPSDQEVGFPGGESDL